MFCSKCGAKLIDGALFCQKCGSKVEYEVCGSKVKTPEQPQQQTSEQPPESTKTYVFPPIKEERIPMGAGENNEDDSVERKLQNDYDRLVESVPQCPTIKKIEKIFSGQTMVGIKMETPIHVYRYDRSFQTGAEQLYAPTRWPFRVFGAVAGFCYALFIGFLGADDYYPVLTICFLACCVALLILLFLRVKEIKAVSKHISGVVNAKLKVRTWLLMIPAVLAVVGIVLGIITITNMVSEAAYNKANFELNQQISEPVDTPTEDIILTQNFKSEIDEISFLYPEDWTVDDVPSNDGLNYVVVLSSPDGIFGSSAEFKIARDETVENDDLYSYTMDDFQEIFSSVDGVQNLSILSLTDITLNGYPMRELILNSSQDGLDLRQWIYMYKKASDYYYVTCTARTSSLDTYEPIFQAMMESYRAMGDMSGMEESVTGVDKNIASASDLFYKGECALTLFVGAPKGQVERILDMLGYSDAIDGTPVTGELLYGATEYWVYDGISLLFDDAGCVEMIYTSPDYTEFNGITLDKTMDEITALLGPSDYNQGNDRGENDGEGDFNESDSYVLIYEFLDDDYETDYEMVIVLPDEYSTPDSISFSLR
jgi:hypothetical protein